ncbi:MAG: hypothetical protein GY940_00935 [bacterium]|nr:hypothetical protein [bacterium]
MVAQEKFSACTEKFVVVLEEFGDANEKNPKIMEEIFDDTEKDSVVFSVDVVVFERVRDDTELIFSFLETIPAFSHIKWR